MSVPIKTDPRWRRALTGQEPKVASLATKLILNRLREDVRRNPDALGSSIAQLHEFFTANAFAARDLPAL